MFWHALIFVLFSVAYKPINGKCVTTLFSTNSYLNMWATCMYMFVFLREYLFMHGYWLSFKLSFWNKGTKHVLNICPQYFWLMDVVAKRFSFKMIWKSSFLIIHLKRYIYWFTVQNILKKICIFSTCLQIR